VRVCVCVCVCVCGCVVVCVCVCDAVISRRYPWVGWGHKHIVNKHL